MRFTVTTAIAARVIAAIALLANSVCVDGACGLYSSATDSWTYDGKGATVG
eukprot:CAMPEP_0194302896 /NCGR_PEP_ID=MMETSP0171-20130528/760_1 /TAXON_ID=218684 /ORGANISM="Corethron pennatum, Strain L29A3" /LENGTH=50 /DNA_ID=CAMNT_0039053553 /DNA_START=194 /DNA_END=343 /DNA_ORIENTATION=+